MTVSHTILLIDGEGKHAEILREALQTAADGPFEIVWTKSLAEGLASVHQRAIWAIFLNLTLPDSRGLETVHKLLGSAPNVPTLILCRPEDEKLAFEALRLGAKDYLLEDHLDAYSLVRAIRNMVERRAAADSLFTEQEWSRVTLDSIGDAVLSIGISENITYLNPVAERMTGWNSEEACGRGIDEVFRIIDSVTREKCMNPMRRAIQKNKTVVLTPNCTLIRRDGREAAIEDSAAPIHNSAGTVIGAVIVFHDVSEARAMGLEMSHFAQHDVLTGLPNRLLLNDRLTQSLASARRNGTRAAVLYLDLDGFKYINDSLGHSIGDKLLQSVSKTLLACVRTSDTVSRQGGDEFIILLSEIANADDAGTKAGKILSALGAPHEIEGQCLRVSGSIGISTYPQDGHDAETLTKNADVAMYQAKEKGRNNFQFFEKGMNVRALERQSVAGGLHGALERSEFLVHYQPKVNLKSGEITGVEALLRWQHPERGMVGPLQFISIAEDCGLMLPIGRWVLRESCRQAKEWQDAGLPEIGLAVNVSSIELRSAGFLEGVRSVLEETGLAPHLLELELTESVLMHHVEFTAPALRKLKAMGVRLAVDDFGAGYSSLSYLRNFPLDTLKVDRSFIQTIEAESDIAPIISAVINMGRSLNHLIVAEGVETAGQLAFLQARGCDEGQGYYFSRPVPAAQFAKLLRNGIAMPAWQGRGGESDRERRALLSAST